MGVFIITSIFLGVRPLENDLSGFHLEGIYSIKSLNTKLNGPVKESFAYMVCGDTYEKEEFLKLEEEKNSKSSSHWRANY